MLSVLVSRSPTHFLAPPIFQQQIRQKIEGFYSIFFWSWFSRFCWGFWQKRGAERGFLMVNLWWIAGENVVLIDTFSASENFPLLLNLFLVGPIGRSCVGLGAWAS